jgi:beta-glucanase (GH16 family)
VRAAAGGDAVLIWSDEFETDGLPDPAKWRYDVGGGGWGNDEAQFYTEARVENARVEDGRLIIEARQEPWPSARRAENDYTSARLVSKGFGDWTYGRVEVRAKVPAGRGTWPAIWMLPTGNAYGTWPRSGEIDIMEHVGYDMGTVHGSLHTLANNWLTGTQPTGSTSVPTVAEAFHTYAVEWSPEAIRFFVDEEMYYEAINEGTGWEAWPFDQPFHLILNLAVGGFWGGREGIDPDIWPARLEIEYVRVYDLGETEILDTDGDTVPNTTDPDDDGDGLSDTEEHALGTNLINADTDGDGFSDFEEIEAGTFPLLRGSYPGSNANVLMINNDFAVGEDPWIVHTNKLDAAGNWIGQSGSWGGVYSVFDYISTNLDGEITFSSYAEGDAPQAEHLLYQEWNPLTMDFLPGDTIRFRGTARAEGLAEGIDIQAFIRVLDFSFQPMPGTAIVDIPGETVTFELESRLGEEPFNVLQAGFLIRGSQAEAARVTFSGIETTLNETSLWALWAEEDDHVNSGTWLGWLDVAQDPYIWSYRLNRWLYLDSTTLTESGGWVFIRRD